MANHRKGVPAGWQWRDGRPRWIPSPTLRAAGWKGCDLKDARGAYLGRGPSFDAAQGIVDAVAAWRAGEPIPFHAQKIAPAARLGSGGAADDAAPSKMDPRSIGALLDAYLGDPAAVPPVPPSNEFAAIRNQADRRSKLSRFVDVLASYAKKPGPAATPAERAAYAAARAKVRALSIDVLEPPPPGDSASVDFLYKAYWAMKNEVGLHMAHGMMSDVSAWLAWCVKPRRAIRANWAETVDRETPPGRIRVGSWEELAALVKAADQLKWPSIGDAVILGVDLSWSQADRLKLTWPQIRDGRVHGARQKTGRKGATPLLASLGLPRLEAIKARQAAALGSPGAQYTHVLVCESTGRPWTARYYRQIYAEVRAHAAKDCPSVADLNDQDLRDTAITVAYDAGLELPEIASRSLHSLRRIHDVLDKHYGDVRQTVGDNGAKKLNAYLAQAGVTL